MVINENDPLERSRPIGLQLDKMMENNKTDMIPFCIAIIFAKELIRNCFPKEFECAEDYLGAMASTPSAKKLIKEMQNKKEWN